MSALLRILFLDPLAFILACIAAAVVLIAGLTRGIVPPPDGAEFTAMTMAATVGVGTLAALPSFLAIVAAEAFGWRSPFYWLAIGALLALIAATTPVGIVMMQVVGTFVMFLISVPRLRDYDGSGANLATIALAAGFVGGFVYWLIAGRLAGTTNETESEPASPQTH